MRLLLDTHTLLWWDTANDRLSPTARTLLEDPANDLMLSVVSLWEMHLKTRLGKLELRVPLEQLVQEQVARNDVFVLPVEAAHVYALEALPGHHKDPFDRLLIAQATTEGTTLVSKDEVFKRYPVDLIW